MYFLIGVAVGMFIQRVLLNPVKRDMFLRSIDMPGFKDKTNVSQ